jgi:hypothetical protein
VSHHTSLLGSLPVVLTFGGGTVALIEIVNAMAMHHLKRFAGCLAGGVGVAAMALIGVVADRKWHVRLAAAAAANHESIGRIEEQALTGIAVIFTVAAYGFLYFRDRRGGFRPRRRSRERGTEDYGPPPAMYRGGF